METDIVAPATPTEPTAAPALGETATPSPEPSIAEHEAQFGKNKPDVDDDGNTIGPPAERPRHRAKSQQAKAEDAPRIAELTKKWRDAERERDEWRAKASTRPEPAAVPAASHAATAPPVPAREPAKSGKPTWSQFEEKIGSQYDTWAAAQDAYADARDDWKEAQIQQARQQESTQQSFRAVQDTYVTRARDFAQKTPDFGEKTQAAAAAFDAAPQLLQAAVILYDNGPEIAYYLATHPDVLDDLSLLTDGKPVTDASVALVQRRFSQYRAQAAQTGSVAPAIPRTPAPRPPNPVRTGPMKPTDDLPGDDASIAEHERAFGKRRR